MLWVAAGGDLRPPVRGDLARAVLDRRGPERGDPGAAGRPRQRPAAQPNRTITL